MHWLEAGIGLAGLSFFESRSPQATQMYQSLLPVAHRLAELAPLNLQAMKQEANIHELLAQALQVPDSKAALQHTNKQIAILTNLSGRFPGDRDLKEELGSALTEAAGPLTNFGDYDEAAQYFERSIRISQQFLETEPHNALVQRRLFVAYGNYCVLLGIPWSANMGKPAEARGFCEKSAAIARELSAADPLNQTGRMDLGVALGQLGMIDPDADKVADSLKILEEALSILDPVLQANPNSAILAMRTGLLREYAGRRLQRLGRLSAAADYFRRGLTAVEVTMKANPGQVSATPVALGNEEGLAEVFAQQGVREDALAYAEQAVERARKYAALTPGRIVPIGHLGEAYCELAWVERTLNDWDNAATDAERAESIWHSIDDKGVLSVHRSARARTEALLLELAAHRAAAKY